MVELPAGLGRGWFRNAGARSLGLCSSPSLRKLFLLASTEGLGLGRDGELAPVGRGIEEAVLGTGRRDSLGRPLGRFVESMAASLFDVHTGRFKVSLASKVYTRLY